MSANTDTTPQAEPATQVIYKADVAVQFFPDHTTRVVVLIDDGEPDLIDTDGGDITDAVVASDALDAAERVVRSEMVIAPAWLLSTAEAALNDRLEWLDEWGDEESQHKDEGWLEEERESIDEALREIARMRGEENA